MAAAFSVKEKSYFPYFLLPATVAVGFFLACRYARPRTIQPKPKLLHVFYYVALALLIVLLISIDKR